MQRHWKEHNCISPMLQILRVHTRGLDCDDVSNRRQGRECGDDVH